MFDSNSSKLFSSFTYGQGTVYQISISYVNGFLRYHISSVWLMLLTHDKAAKVKGIKVLNIKTAVSGLISALCL